MISEKCSFKDFAEALKGRDFYEMLSLTEQEATEAERYLYKQPNKTTDDKSAVSYVTLLKDVVLYMRHGIRTHAVRQIDLQDLEFNGKVC